MKKKLLSLLLAGMMVIGMLPVMASAEGIDSAAALVIALGGDDYATAEGNNVTLKKNVTIGGTTEINVPTGVTLVIPTSTTLEVTGAADSSNEALKNLAKSAGNIKISGGTLKLPSAASVTSVEGFVPTIWFGPEGSKGRMEIAEGGSVTISGLNNLASGNCTWTVAGNVTIPEGARANLNMTDSTGTTRGVKLLISNGATLTVDGILRGVAGDKAGSRVASSVEVAQGGTLDTTKGTLSLSTKPKVVVNGTFHIGDKGITSDTNGTTPYNTSGNISMSVGATITVTENSASKNTIAGLVSVSGGSGETVALENGQLVPVASGAGGSEGAEAYILSGNKITQYGDVKALLDATGAKSGDRVVLKKDLTWEKDTPFIGEGVTLVVPKGITLTASTLQNAGSLMTSEGSIEIQAGGILTLPNDDQTDEGGDKGQTTDDWVGDDGKARMQLTEGIMTFSFGGGKKPTLNIDGNVTVPEGERAFLHVTLGPDGKTATGIDTTLKTGSVLTVNGELVLATGETAKGAALTIENGATATVDGTMTVGAAASLTTNNALTVNGKLTINGANTEGFPEGTITGTITLGADAKVTVAASRDKAAEIAKNIEPADGYEMEKDDNGNWVVKEKETTPPSGGGSTGGGSSSSETYDNTAAATTNGKVTVTDAKKGETATITTTPDKGYKVGSVTAKDEKGNNVPVSNAGNGKYTFTQPEGKVTVTVTFVWDNPFKDVKSGDWWYNAVQYVHLNGLMAGTGTTTFSPTAILTRAQAVQVLYNLEGQPTVTGKNTFTDVASNHWGIKAITWASENGVVAGVGNNKFDPDVNVSREQFAQMMYNYATYKKYNTSASADLTKFPDDDTVSSWATKALAWANAEGLINGTEEDGTVILAPNGTANRAQAASILMNFDKNVVM